MLGLRLALCPFFALIALFLLVMSANPMEGGPCSPSGDIDGERYRSGGVYLKEWLGVRLRAGGGRAAVAALAANSIQVYLIQVMGR